MAILKCNEYLLNLKEFLISFIKSINALINLSKILNVLLFTG